MSRLSYPIAPNNALPTIDGMRSLVRIINNIMRGKTNTVADITLQTSAATTTVTDINVGGNSSIHLMPQTANAAAELGNGTLYISTRSKQSFVVTHANNAQADRTFTYSVVG